ncbi:hypothetical protein [Jannaschia marina]|uniref:hypothetical protein n=1 Tax=Jannaschia marina TaxID=2741674 RepID=UPI002E2AA9F3|nr:hypothetical protein [Jannaschia marina]
MLDGMVEHIGQIAGGKSRGGASLDVRLLDWDHLDRVARRGLEGGGHLFLHGDPFRLYLHRPEADRIGTGSAAQ